jgi:hypothetical protein
MKRFKNHLIAMAVLSVLAIVGTIMNSHQAQAQGPPGGLAVNIVNPLPVPVTGSLGISGTPNVNVANPATAPVLALNVNDPGRIAYQAVSNKQGCGTNVVCILTFPTVPTGHRLVIQHVSIEAMAGPTVSTINSGLARIGHFLPTQPPPALVPVPLNAFPLTVEHFGNGEGIADQPVLLYLDQGEKPGVEVFLNAFVDLSVSAYLTGYMLDCSIAPCAAIAP